jgi:F-type H+-transporting ATPase subunit epsilon
VPIKLEIVTQERRVYSSDDVLMVVAPGTEGEMAILPHHAPLITSLREGVMQVRHLDDREELLAIHGGFMEVLPSQISVLADAAERADEIDIARAEEARRRAEELMQQQGKDRRDDARAEMALRRSLTRLKVAEGRRRRTGRTPKSSELQ